MARKWENTREKEHIKHQRRTERKKRDAMTLTAMKSGLIAFGCMFVSLLLGLLWQEGISPYVTPNNPQSFVLFVGIGCILGAIFSKRCYNMCNYEIVFPGFLYYVCCFRTYFHNYGHI